MTYSAGTFHLLALACTLSVEVALIALWAYFFYPRPWRAIACAVLVNLVVHTLFWYSQASFVAQGTFGLLRAELLVVFVEGVIYTRVLALKGPTPWLLSLFLNLASLIVGLWMWHILFSQHWQ